jgi:hypothetical protein
MYIKHTYHFLHFDQKNFSSLLKDNSPASLFTDDSLLLALTTQVTVIAKPLQGSMCWAVFLSV